MNGPVVDEQGRPGRWVLLDEPHPVRLAPIPETPEAGGFRFARVFNDPTPDGKPFVDPARGRVTDPDERRRILEFLAGGTVVADTGTNSVDLLEPRRAGAIRNVNRTDGRWIWSEAVAYYLRWHQVPPEPELWAHIEAKGYCAAMVGDDVAAAAREAWLKVARSRHAAIDDWLVQTGQMADPARFPIAFQERLRALGWTPGRDVSDQVDQWLAEQLPTVQGAHFELPGEPAYRPFDAALRVLREFGGLTSTDDSFGVTSARVPFRLMPGRDPKARSLRLNLADALVYGQWLGQPVFQVGVIEDGVILVVAQDGSVHLVGDVERYVGAGFDEALRPMMDGDLPVDDDDYLDNIEVGFGGGPVEIAGWRFGVWVN